MDAETSGDMKGTHSLTGVDIFLTPIGNFQGNNNRAATANPGRRSPSRLTNTKSRTPVLKRPLVITGVDSLFSGDKLVDEAVAACHMLKIPPKELLPKYLTLNGRKLDDFIEPSVG